MAKGVLGRQSLDFPPLLILPSLYSSFMSAFATTPFLVLLLFFSFIVLFLFNSSSFHFILYQNAHLSFLISTTPPPPVLIQTVKIISFSTCLR